MRRIIHPEPITPADVAFVSVIPTALVLAGIAALYLVPGLAYALVTVLAAAAGGQAFAS
jgi:hypothetical protein